MKPATYDGVIETTHVKYVRGIEIKWFVTKLVRCYWQIPAIVS